jgi:hypothetical protein
MVIKCKEEERGGGRRGGNDIIVLLTAHADARDKNLQGKHGWRSEMKVKGKKRNPVFFSAFQQTWLGPKKDYDKRTEKRGVN